MGVVGQGGRRPAGGPGPAGAQRRGSGAALPRPLRSLGGGFGWVPAVRCGVREPVGRLGGATGKVGVHEAQANADGEEYPHDNV
jgi:hypothetical protein